jgi:hypothetical protein
MCWNADISLNTFVFATFSLAFIYFSNTYTKYKSKTFDNPLVYAFLLLVASMQLIEYFVWKNLDNKVVNSRLSRLASVVLVSQPMVLIWMIPNIRVKYAIMGIYTTFIVLGTIYHILVRDNSLPVYMTVAKNGHLTWGWINYKGNEHILLFTFLSFFVISLWLVQNNVLSFMVIVSLVFSLYYYYSEHTIGTMWCWSVNLFMLYFLVDILLIHPFMEYNRLC